ncbi:MAG: DegV family protein [Lachnospiraceae bacterium]|nr:DegV family protein [Lachnospiraceae bacterium]
MHYKIVSDSGVNLRRMEAAVDYATVPLKIFTDEREFIDNLELDIREMVSYLKEYKGKSGTACPSVSDWLDAFGDAERVFCFTITSTLSGSYNAACVAKADYEAEYPGRSVVIVDSLSAGPEMQIWIERVAEMIMQGKGFEEICDEISTYKEKTGLMFSLESLKNLANNGRVSPLVAGVAGALGIRIVGRASAGGELEPMDKCRGEKKALAKIISRMKEMGFKGGKVLIDHCNNLSAADQLKQQIMQEYPEAGISIGETCGLCSFYAEKGGLMIGFEK